MLCNLGTTLFRALSVICNIHVEYRLQIALSVMLTQADVIRISVRFEIGNYKYHLSVMVTWKLGTGGIQKIPIASRI